MPRNLKTWAKWKNFQKHNPPKQSEEEAESLNGPISSLEIDAVIKKLPTHKSPSLHSQENFTNHLEES